ncbi:hypothetical protein DRN97_01805 [Methanosarcinales archaeon]|nr:MAG: hypothetical protein DRN97_01805 [Methanosarcinales archaeon]
MKDTTLKKLLLFFALLSAITVAMPSTISLIGGQHTWYNMQDLRGIKASPDEWDRTPCWKCHDIELSSLSAVHQNLDRGNDPCYNLTCYINASVNGTMPSCREYHENGTVPEVPLPPTKPKYKNKT